MKAIHFQILAFLAVLVILGFIVLKSDQKQVEIGATSNSSLYPDKVLTPGLVATTDFTELTAVSSCGTYSQCHRKTTSNMKAIVCKEYPTNCTGTQEIDHFCPLALGCADDVKNLWAEPEHVMINGQDFGFHTKDKLETYLVSQMKAGKITPSDAQQCILADWVGCYKKYFNSQSFGAINMDSN